MVQLMIVLHQSCSKTSCVTCARERKMWVVVSFRATKHQLKSRQDLRRVSARRLCAVRHNFKCLCAVCTISYYYYEHEFKPANHRKGHIIIIICVWLCAMICALNNTVVVYQVPMYSANTSRRYYYLWRC